MKSLLLALAFAISVYVVASAASVVSLLSQGGANPGVTSANFSLALLVVTVLSGVGTLRGVVPGGVVLRIPDFRLVGVSCGDVQALPAFFRIPLAEPLSS